MTKTKNSSAKKGAIKKKKIAHELTLHTSMIKGMCQIITRAQFVDYCKNGMPQEIYEQLNYNYVYMDHIFDWTTNLSIDEMELSDFQRKFKKKYNQALKKLQLTISKQGEGKIIPFSKSKKLPLKYAIVGKGEVRGCEHKLTIREEFDFEKLEIYLTKNKILGYEDIITFDLKYAGEQFEYYTASSGHESTFLVCSNGDTKEFEVNDEDN